MLLTLYIIAAILCAVTTIITFILYVRARMADRSEHPRHTPAQHQAKLDWLDKKEDQYQTWHFVTLALFVLFGVLILVQVSKMIP